MGKKKKGRRSSAVNQDRGWLLAVRGPRNLSSFEGLSWAGLAGLLAYFLSVSWRKWPDPLIDFGRELYLPWRISQGALLYRDLEGHYGPLSQYFNGLVFAFFGPGLMVLVIANLLIFAAILTLLYLLCRLAWGPGAAFVATAVYISVFGFSQLTGISNYNYATPYAHETTHGLLVALALTLVLTRWVGKPTPSMTFVAGFLYGLSFVLKPEFILAGGLVSLVALLVRWRSYSRPGALSALAGIIGLILPTLGFTAYFSLFLPFRDAVSAACQAWLRFVSSDPQSSVAGIQTGFSGLDNTSSNLVGHLIATGVAGVFIGLVVLIGWSIKKRLALSVGIVITLLGSAGLVWFSSFYCNWLEVGHCLLGLVLVYLAVQSILLLSGKWRPENTDNVTPRILLAVLGIALMARMALNGRIYQYGFYQAALAGSIIPAILVGELPDWLQASRREKRLIWVLIAALIVPGIFRIALSSQTLLRTKTVPVGEGVDRFYAFARKMEPTGEIVAAVTTALETVNKTDTLTVFPEGIMINYLARVPSTVPGFFYAATGPKLIAQLETRPPKGVVLISRDLREYGVERYGDKPGNGQEILLWLSQHYHQVAHVGGNPLDNRQRGAVLFKRNLD